MNDLLALGRVGKHIHRSIAFGFGLLVFGTGDRYVKVCNLSEKWDRAVLAMKQGVAPIPRGDDGQLDISETIALWLL